MVTPSMDLESIIVASSKVPSKVAAEFEERDEEDAPMINSAAFKNALDSDEESEDNIRDITKNEFMNALEDPEDGMPYCLWFYAEHA